ncbi:hypothetical protein BGZ80_001518 [Entomortierella chlamydospora]|uniref:RNA 3'-terminal-phosphate cyclase (ATP) n=1 Tax=Entomortierella chlamydospora TaxID=101097 RepID=A0A9P6MRK2_9FUNG|nr:hypothetical protein BGZ79_002465 [Entomortierella chlamydospora]KAG0010390.1 hypothetical protein BGZ80_001518 [Entomortierella chlamydospora]
MNLDGGYSEGGGQIVRNGASYSAILQQPLTISNIRKNRPSPGLKNQHLTGIRLVNEICNGQLQGDELNSIRIHLSPSLLKPAGSRFLADAKTAGSICLMIQVSFPVLLFCPPTTETNPRKETRTQQLVLKGGTDVSNSPPIDYICNVFNPMFARLFCSGKTHCRINVDRRGYMPKGGGQVTMNIESLKPGEYLSPAILLERGSVVRIKGRIVTGGRTDLAVALNLKKFVLENLQKSEYGHIKTLDEDIQVAYEPECYGSGSSINLLAETSTGCLFGGGALGGSKRALEKTANEACEELLRNLRHGGCVDEFLQDMIVIFVALAKGKSQVVTGPLTSHTTTAFYVAKAMTGVDFSYHRLPTVEGTEHDADQQERYLIECEGIGYIMS